MLLCWAHQADSQLPLHFANGTAADLVSTAWLILSADKPFYFFKNEVTYVVDRLADRAVDVGFGARLWRRGELNPHSLGRRARGLDRQRSSGTQSGLARLDKPDPRRSCDVYPQPVFARRVFWAIANFLINEEYI